MEGQTLNVFYNRLVLIPKLAQYFQYVLNAVGCLLIIITLILIIKNQRTPSAALHEGLGPQSDQLPSSQTPLLQDDPQDGQPASSKS
ncbi:scavenger receptor class B member 1-like [Vombatus ursinus]|uniref:scavenger receptor class B member 1-like n=1 Tax=Vombatus ursinus TaxID=29139 RepID=UPI000FFD00D3|nr:scavenger receptor class B member 1-like [Vombatus ursinus]XP_027714271.1 scavenger receptor class B member 1-like [Vombatus ursinus]